MCSQRVMTMQGFGRIQRTMASPHKGERNVGNSDYQAFWLQL